MNDPFRAATGDPHVHERWGSARKLELSYCITSMPGDDAELLASYEHVIRSVALATAEWERVTGTNFVHVAEVDTPDSDPHFTMVGETLVARADCDTSKEIYFGVLALQAGAVQGLTNAVPQAWNSPDLEPASGALTRIVLLSPNLVLDFGGPLLIGVLRHEFGHMLGFLHEETTLPDQEGASCTDPDPRLLTPMDSSSVMATPGCPGLADSELLSHRDRLSAFFLHHNARSRFETRSPSVGYRYGGDPSGGAELLWHSEGATEGILWRPEMVDGLLSFNEEMFSYFPPDSPPTEDWFPNEDEVVIPLQFQGDSSAHDLLFFGPGPSNTDFAVINDGGSASAMEWSFNAFAVPVVGRFDSEDLDRDIVYLYQPGTEDSAVVMVSEGAVSVVADPPQQTSYAFPLAAPFRGSSFPDDIMWQDPISETVEFWRLGTGILELAASSTVSQGEMGLASGEYIPAVGDFNGDGRADIMWHGIANLNADLEDIVDVLWLSESTPDSLAFALVPKEVGNSYRPFVGDFDGDGIDDIFWHRSWGMTSEGPSADSTGLSFVWYFDDMGGHESKAFVLDADHSPYVGDFDGDGCHDIAWFDSVNDTLGVWLCLPTDRDFDCGSVMPTPPDSAPIGVHWGF